MDGSFKSTQFCFILGLAFILNIWLLIPLVEGYWAQGLPGIKCIDRYPEGKLACDDGNCNFKNPGNIFKLACDTDCRAQHGATYGYCLESNICNCGPPVYSTGNYSFQCLDIKKAEIFEQVCDEDCRCTHNKIGGGCNFFTKACECGPTNKSPVLNCPYKNSNEYFITLLERYKGLKINVVEKLQQAT